MSQPFDATAPLPAGTLLLEASAGTGKTYSIASLVLRLVAEADVPLDRLLVVTFTRAAAAELRDRIRQRLTTAIAAHDAAAHAVASATTAGSTPGPISGAATDDEVLAALLRDGTAGGAAMLTARRRRLAAAVERFDDATIDTIHGFCQRALQLGAPDVEVDLDATLTEDLGDLLEELVDDTRVRLLRHLDPHVYPLVGDALDHDRLLAIVRAVNDEPDLEVLPTPTGGDALAALTRQVAAFRAHFAAQADTLGRWLADTQQAGGFGGRLHAYRPHKLGPVLAALDTWVRTGEADAGALPGYLTHIGRAKISGHARAGVTLPATLDVTDAADALREAASTAATEVLAAFAAAVPGELAARKQRQGVLSFSDLLVRLDRALHGDPQVAAAVATTLRERFDVALIDEFQDTDPVQWRIFAALFGLDPAAVGGPVTGDAGARLRLALIGDPKQAIYGFRGGDVHTYLRAAADVPPANRRTLMVNHRSDARYVAALDALLGRADLAPDGPFATPGIDHVTVTAAERHAGDRLLVAGEPLPALELKLVPRALAVDRDDPGAELPKVIGKGWARPQLARLVAADVVALLDAGATRRDGPVHRPLEPRDLAVLVRTNRQAGMVQTALLDAGVPAVVGGTSSVMESPEATALQRLLDAMLRPASDRAVRAALASPVLGVSAEALADLDDDVVERWLDTIEAWSRRWRRDGIAAVLRTVLATAGTAPRLLGGLRGERQLTNLMHVGELLHVAETELRLRPEGLAAWLRERRHAPRGRGEDDELRLESDEQAVSVVTVHRAKGLQYPVVWCPFLWDDPPRQRAEVLRFLDPATQRLSLDLHVDRDAPPKAAHRRHAAHDEWRESLRLAYVALTRAEHRTVVYTGAFRDIGRSALGRLLHGAGYHAAEGQPEPPPPNLAADDLALRRDLEAIAAAAAPAAAEVPDPAPAAAEVPDPAPAAAEASDPAPAAAVIAVTEVDAVARRVRWQRPPAEQAPLSVRTLDRPLDRAWQRASFSSLIRTDPAAPSGDDERAGIDHDAEVRHDHAGPDPLPSAALDAPDVPLAGFPRGAAAGTFLHELLEHLDLAVAAEDPEHLRMVVDARLPRAGLGPVDIPALVTGMQAVLTTPLGPAVGDQPLAAVTERLDELSFDLPVAGGDHPSGTAPTLARIAAVLGDAAEPGSPLAAAAERLAARPQLPVRGFLTGSIDLVTRFDGRFVVIDHKSNGLGQRVTAPDGTTRWRSVAAHYTPDRLARAMVAGDYHLQAHLYLVALHRYLRWRLGGRYDYDRDVAGAWYLFLRGMVGPDAPRDADGAPTGVHAHRPDREVIEALDAVLAGGT